MGRLTGIRSLTCQIASKQDGSPHFESELDTISPEGIRVFRFPNDLTSEVWPDGVPYSQGFGGLDVETFVVNVSYRDTTRVRFMSVPLLEIQASPLS